MQILNQTFKSIVIIDQSLVQATHRLSFNYCFDVLCQLIARRSSALAANVTEGEIWPTIVDVRVCMRFIDYPDLVGGNEREKRGTRRRRRLPVCLKSRVCARRERRSIQVAPRRPCFQPGPTCKRGRVAQSIRDSRNVNRIPSPVC